MVEDTQTKLDYLEAEWITSMRDYMAVINAKFTLKEKYIPELQRQGDSYIMDRVLAHKFEPKQRKRINWCRMYLGLVTVSDMATASGTHILKAAHTGDKEGINTSNQPMARSSQEEARC